MEQCQKVCFDQYEDGKKNVWQLVQKNEEQMSVSLEHAVQLIQWLHHF